MQLPSVEREGNSPGKTLLCFLPIIPPKLESKQLSRHQKYWVKDRSVWTDSGLWGLQVMYMALVWRRNRYWGEQRHTLAFFFCIFVCPKTAVIHLVQHLPQSKQRTQYLLCQAPTYWRLMHKYHLQPCFQSALTARYRRLCFSNDSCINFMSHIVREN